MTLLVRTPPGFAAERAHVLEVVLGRWWGLPWRRVVEDRPDVRIEQVGDPTRGVTLPDLFFDTATWGTAASLPAAPHWRPLGVPGTDAMGADTAVPVLFALPDLAALVRVVADGARLSTDVLGTVFFLITRYEETVVAERDGLGRFPAAASVVRGAALEVPVADAHAEVLWAACRLVWPELRRPPSTYEIRPTHDVDDPLAVQGRTATQHARQLAGDLVRRRSPGLAARRARAVVAARRGHHDPDPHNTFDFLMDVSDRHGLHSAFYFLAHRDPAPGPTTCRLLEHPWVRGLVGRVARRGHEVGFHAAFGTWRDPAALTGELARLVAVAADQGVDQDRWGGRQHYLQWEPSTWALWEAAGLDYDTTVAFRETVGFRTGTCRPYPVFDLAARRPLRLVEEPFQVMDVTVADGATAVGDEARAAVVRVAAQCRRFGGTLGLLWHNDELLRTAAQRRWYEDLITDLTHP